MADGFDSVTVCTTLTVSTALAADTVAMADTSLSTMPVETEALLPLTTRFSKLPPVALSMVTVKLSAPSARLSSIVATLKLAALLPAGMVTVVTPEKSLPSAAVPL